jgi:hypothetical protein
MEAIAEDIDDNWAAGAAKNTLAIFHVAAAIPTIVFYMWIATVTIVWRAIVVDVITMKTSAASRTTLKYSITRCRGRRWRGCSCT